MKGPAEIILYQTRDGLWCARITLTDRRVPTEPYKVPAQITRTTNAHNSAFFALAEASSMLERVM